MDAFWSPSSTAYFGMVGPWAHALAARTQKRGKMAALPALFRPDTRPGARARAFCHDRGTTSTSKSVPWPNSVRAFPNGAPGNTGPKSAAKTADGVGGQEALPVLNWGYSRAWSW